MAPELIAVRQDPLLEGLEEGAFRLPVPDPGLEALTSPQGPELTLVAPAPPPAVVEAPEALVAAVALRSPSVPDVDRLWDWIRTDNPPRLTEIQVETSLELHAKIATLMAQTREGTAACFAVDDAGTHVGFTFINPIHDGHGALHAYLSPAARGRGLRLGREVIALLTTEYPNVRLVATTMDPRIMKFARRIGLTSVTFYLSKESA
jgi:RimJ/RimL family protein N-acetyltransferase